MLNLLEYPNDILNENIIVAENLQTEEYFIMTALQSKQLNYHYVRNMQNKLKKYIKLIQYIDN